MEPISVAVVHPCNEVSFESALNARDAGLIDPILIGPRAKLEAMLVKQLGRLQTRWRRFDSTGGGGGNGLKRLFMTHPPLNERIAALEHAPVKEME